MKKFFCALSELLWKLCLATHQLWAWSWCTQNGCGCDVLPMLYSILIHNYIKFYYERILIAVTEALTLLLYILMWVDVCCVCVLSWNKYIIHMFLSITINNCPCNKYEQFTSSHFHHVETQDSYSHCFHKVSSYLWY